MRASIRESCWLKETLIRPAGHLLPLLRNGRRGKFY